MNFNKNITIGFLIFWAIIFLSFSDSKSLYNTKNGKINFVSDAPLEIIKASSGKLAGILNTKDKSFVFKVSMRSFNGFNSPLQKVHFNENYIESDKYPDAKFKGKIIEDINFRKDGTYKVRAKGKFSIHGVQQSKTIRCKLTIKGKEIKISATFKVNLEDHDIKIPTIVNQKLAEVITVKIKTSLKPR